MRKVAFVLAVILCCGCSNSKRVVKEQECKLPNVIELEQFASAHNLHLQVIDTHTSFRYHVRLWPYSEGYDCDKWAYTGSNDNLDTAITEAKEQYEKDARTIYDHDFHDTTLCKR